MLDYFLYMVSWGWLLPSTYTPFKKQKLGKKYYLNRIRNILGQLWKKIPKSKFLTTIFSASKPNSNTLFFWSSKDSDLCHYFPLLHLFPIGFSPLHFCDLVRSNAHRIWQILCGCQSSPLMLMDLFSYNISHWTTVPLKSPDLSQTYMLFEKTFSSIVDLSIPQVLVFISQGC